MVVFVVSETFLGRAFPFRVVAGCPGLLYSIKTENLLVPRLAFLLPEKEDRLCSQAQNYSPAKFTADAPEICLKSFWDFYVPCWYFWFFYDKL